MEYKNAQWVAEKTPDGKTVLNPKDNIRVEIDGVPSNVPVDLGNFHYVEIKNKVDAGELTIKDAD
jgi:hypothetical protein|tara:strand:+ start:38 stop:232 length:195 start_codon:yes stop_codon:yes gene_type:complete